ncbi:MAG: LptA/OstA family protein [Verrucomicrobiota bacterium]
MSMKKWIGLMVALFGVLMGSSVQAQTADKKEPLEIFSDYFEFTSAKNVAIFKGNVIVKDPPETQIRCDLLTVIMTTNNTRVEVITAEGNVEIDVVDKDGKKTATGKHATYDVKSNILTLTGEPTITTSFGTLRDAEKVILDRGQGIMKSIGRNRTTIDQKSLEGASGKGKAPEGQPKQ